MHSILRTLGILTVCLTSGQAAVLWTGIQNIPLPTSINGVFVNFATGFSTTIQDPDFNNTDINFFFGGDGILTGASILPARVGTGITDSITLVPSDIPIDESLNFAATGFGASQDHVGNGSGQFPAGIEGHIAFKFDPTRSGAYSYGWMRVTLTSGSSPGILHEWAYSDTPGEQVFVGVVPEPQSLILAALGMILVIGRRR